jgi:hypothetical protein
VGIVPADRHLLTKQTKKAKGKNERAIDAMAAKSPIEMNTWEQRFYDWISKLPNTVACDHHRLKLRLPGGSWYYPDIDAWIWNVRHAGERPGLHVFEVKGRLTDRGKLKLEEAAAAFPYIAFWVVFKSTEGGTDGCPFKIARIRR